MKRAAGFILLLTLFGPAGVRAQDGVFDFFETPKADLASLSNVPARFRLFVPDTVSRIITNPARAVYCVRRFLYWNQSLNSQPPVSMAYLGSEWMIQIDGQITVANSETDIHEQFDRLLPLESTGALTRRTVDSENMDFNARFSNFGRMRRGAYAFGLLLHWRRLHQASVNFNSRDVSRLFINSRGESSDISVRDVSDKTRGFEIGLEFSFVGSNWDWMNAMTFGRPVQKKNVLDDRTFMSRDSTFVAGQYQVNSGASQQNLTARQEVSPAVLSVNSYFQKSVAKWGNIFFSIDAARSVDAGATFDYRHFSVESSETRTPSSTDGDSLANTTSYRGLHESRYRHFEGSAGYVWLGRSRGFYVFAGINPAVACTKWEEIAIDDLRRGQDTGVRLLNRRQISASLELPLYISYAAAGWCDIFAGLNRRYAWVSDELTLGAPAVSGASSPPPRPADHSESTTISSSAGSYMGILFRHRSGLAAHVDFGGDFGRISSWLVSIGYHF